MGCLGCAGHVVIWGRQQGHNKNDFTWLFEKGDQDQGDLRKNWSIVYPDSAVEPVFLKKCDQYLSDKPRRIRPFEAADLVGYENLLSHKKLSSAELASPLLNAELPVIPFEELRKPMQRLFDLPGGDKWGYISEREILKYCEKYKIPTR